MILLHCDTDLHWFVGVCAWDLALFLLSQTFKYIFKKKNKKTLNCEKMKKAKGQLVQTRNHLQKASVPAYRALWCTHREVQHACFIAGWVETEALKAEFQMTTWETETRGSEEFNGLLVRKMPWCVCVQFHVQLCLCSLDDISDSKEPDKISPMCFFVGCCRWFFMLRIVLNCKMALNKPWHQLWGCAGLRQQHTTHKSKLLIPVRLFVLYCAFFQIVDF